MKIVVADGDTETIDLTQYALREYGYTVIAAHDGLHALRRWEAEQPDLVIVNVRLPGSDGFEVCRTIRQRSNTPVILVSDRAADEDAVRGFEAGADDYIAKPFSHRQLAMRIRAVLNRSRGAIAEKVLPQLQLGPGISLDLESRELRRGEQVVRLTPLEFRIVFLLALSPGRVVSTSRLVDYAWTYEAADPSMVKIHISRIRGKLKELGCDPSALKSIRWVGYCLAIEPAAVGAMDDQRLAQLSPAESVPLLVAG
jgi:DNA-binding response OmpR family regulator